MLRRAMLWREMVRSVKQAVLDAAGAQARLQAEDQRVFREYDERFVATPKC
jgi:hypothetical protein